MTATPAERAAILSARIHLEVNAGRLFAGDISALSIDDVANALHLSLGFWGECWDIALGFSGCASTTVLRRLGAELRGIVVGNREGAR